jgi:predicted Zn-dependent protease
MSSFNLNLDTQMSDLEYEWREMYESSIIARAEYQALAADRKANADFLDAARERMDRAEASKARIMAKLERLEERMLNRD